MPKNSITDYDNIASNNTDIQSVDIAEGCAPSGINNAIRELMADLADVDDGTVTLTSPKAASFQVTGNLTVDTNTLYVDSVNNRVGVGTTPAYPLDVNGEIRATSHVRGTGNDALYTIGGASNNNNNIFIGGSSASVANTIAMTTSGSERMRIDSSGNVGIGTSSVNSPSAGRTVLEVNGSSSSLIHLGIGGSAKGQLYHSGSEFRINSIGTAPMTFYANASERMRIDSSGHVIAPYGITLGTATGVYNGANTLDDYEVGTWSPHIKDSSDNTVKVTATDQGKYVKIGEIVHVHFRIYANSVSASFTGYPFVQLPFTTIDVSELNGVQVAYRLNMNTIKGASTQGSTSTMKFSTVNENPYGSMINVGPYTLSGSVRFYGMLTYRVS